MIRDINEIQALATKYSKQQLAHMAQLGLIDPTKAVMAGMMIDRITKTNMQPPQTTVAQDALAPAQQPVPQRMGMQAAPEAPSAGMAALPAGEVGNYAGGGIVAFDEGGEVPGYAGGSQWGSLVGGGFAPPPTGIETQQTFNLMQGAAERDAAEREQRKAAYQQRLEVIRQKMVQGAPLNDEEKTLARANNLSAEPTKQDMAPAFGETSQVFPLQNPPTGIAAAPGAPAVQPAPRKSPVAGMPGAPAAPVVPAMNALPPIDTGIKLQQLEGPEKKDVKTILAEQAAADEAAGVDTKLYDKLRSEYEEKKGKLGERKQEAIGNALMMAGIGLMGARRGQEFQVLGAEGQKALQGLVTANEKIRETEEKLDDKQRELTIAQNEYNRTRSKDALARVNTINDQILATKNKNVEENNKASIEAAKLQLQKYGYDTTNMTHLQIAQLNKEASLQHARITAAAQNRPGETERLMAEYQRRISTEGKESADRWLSELERIRGAGKPQNTFSFEEAMKIVAAKPTNMNATPEQLAQQARELMALGGAGPGVTAGAPVVGAVVGGYKYKGGDPNSQSSWEKVK